MGISFIMAMIHKMKEMVALICRSAPQSKIVLGGYGTILSDDVLKPYADFICREEGVAFFRRLLGKPEIPMPYKHPLITSRMKVFSLTKSGGTGKIFAGLGSSNGCDFCCHSTSSSANTSDCCQRARTSTPSWSGNWMWIRTWCSSL